MSTPMPRRSSPRRRTRSKRATKKSVTRYRSSDLFGKKLQRRSKQTRSKQTRSKGSRRRTGLHRSKRGIFRASSDDSHLTFYTRKGSCDTEEISLQHANGWKHYDKGTVLKRLVGGESSALEYYYERFIPVSLTTAFSSLVRGETYRDRSYVDERRRSKTRTGRHSRPSRHVQMDDHHAFHCLNHRQMQIEER